MGDKIQFLGEKVSLMSGPADETLDTFPGGTVQSFSEDAPLKRRSNPIGTFTDQSMGEVQRDFTGTVPLSRQPHRGYESGTVMGMQSKVPSDETSY